MHRKPLRIGFVIIALLLASGRVAVAGTSGPHINQGIWKGKTSQNQPLQFNVLESNHGLVVQPFLLSFVMTCSSTGTQLEFINEFAGFNVHVTSTGQFRFSIYDELFGLLSFSGTLGDTTGSGPRSRSSPV